MFWTNYHGHCHYCDGKYEPERYVQSAIASGMPVYGFSSHAPVPFACAWTMAAEAAPAYVAEIRKLAERYQSDIEIYCGLEVDFVPGKVSPKSEAITSLGLDYTIGSVHFVDAFADGKPWEIDGAHGTFVNGLEQIFGNNIEQAVSRYFELTRQMIREACPTIIGHLDKIKVQNEAGQLFSEEAPWYQREVQQTLEEIAGTHAIVEVNTRGIYKQKTTETYPSRWVLARMHELRIPVTISSDAHHPDEITAWFTQTAEMLTETGFKYVSVLRNQTWQPVPFSTNGLLLV